jgi:hypothetical protein
MKYFRLFVISAIALFVVMFALSALIPSHIKISRAINIAKGNDSILSYIRDLAKWENWYPGFKEANLKEIITSDGRTVEAKAGNVYLKMLQSGDTLVTVQMQKSKRPVIASWKLIQYVSSDSATIHATMDFDVKWYPWEKLAGLLFEKSYGPVLEQGLENLKKINQEK